MSSKPDFAWLDELELTGPAGTFAEFCKSELLRRGNTDTDFDAAIYTEAVQLVLRKLGALEMEDMQ